MIIDDIAQYLETNSTRLTVGVNLTKSFMPENPNTVTTVFETGGAGPLNAFSTGGTNRFYEQPGIMIHSRSTSYETVRAVMEDVFTILDGVNNTPFPTSTGTHYGSIDAVQSPFQIGRDKNDRFLLSINFDVIKTTG